MRTERWRFVATLIGVVGVMAVTMAACGRPDTSGAPAAPSQQEPTSAPAASSQQEPTSAPPAGEATVVAVQTLPTSAPDAAALPAATEAPAQTSVGVTGEQGTSGITGHAMQGPMCRGPVTVDKPCPDAPIEATVQVEDAATGKRVAEFATGADGAFRQPLAPGNYRLVAQSKAGGHLPMAQPVEVTVEPNQFVEVNIGFDTGMR